jgi:hypothetical protein
MLFLTVSRFDFENPNINGAPSNETRQLFENIDVKFHHPSSFPTSFVVLHCVQVEGIQDESDGNEFHMECRNLGRMAWDTTSSAPSLMIAAG